MIVLSSAGVRCRIGSKDKTFLPAALWLSQARSASPRGGRHSPQIQGANYTPCLGLQCLNPFHSGCCRATQATMPAIKYETPDGIEVIERDEFHTEKDGVVIAYDDGPEHKVTIPQERVVIIHG